MFRKLLLGAALVAGSAAANAGPILLTQGFEPGADLTGWGAVYNSSPAGTTGWFQGNTGIFSADAGTDSSYIAANYLNTDLGGGNIDTWLFLPTLAANGYTTIDFAARTGGALPGDTIQVLVNSLGTASLADFVSLGTLSSLASDSWGHYTFAYDGAAASLTFAFRYLVTDTTQNGDYIGIDTVTVQSVPEPGTLALMAVGILLAPAIARRRRATAQA